MSEQEIIITDALWDDWYKNLPEILKPRLSLHEFKLLGDTFKHIIKQLQSEKADLEERLVEYESDAIDALVTYVKPLSS